MWHTPSGVRILTGAEAEPFRAGLASLLSGLEEGQWGDKLEVGVKTFDELTFEQKLAMLERVGSALLGAHVPCPKLTAVAEATVGAVYHNILNDIELEISERLGCHFRALVRVACRQTDSHDDLPARRSTDFERWEEAVQSLMDCILWDTDWAAEMVPLDTKPDKARLMKARAGIDDDYHTAIAPEPSPAELQRIGQSLRQLVGPLESDEDSPDPPDASDELLW
jgi:hypothetical protein